MESFWSIVALVWTWTGLLVAVGMTLWLVQVPRKPQTIVAWSLSFFLLPIVAPLAYLLIGEPTVRRRARRRSRGKSLAADGGPIAVPRHREDRTIHDMLMRFNAFPARPGNKVEMTTRGRHWFDELFAAVEGARHTVWVEVYILAWDRVGQEFCELLARKVAEGVEVKLLYDHFGSIRFHWRQTRFLREAGIDAAPFVPVTLVSLFTRRTRWHFRNHRKLLVIDNEVAFTGGLNIADHYRDEHWDGVVWKDLGVTVRGPAVGDFARVFREDWRTATGHLLRKPDWPEPIEGGTLVHVVPGGPDDPYEPIRFLFTTMVSRVQRRLEATSPYFVPDAAMLYTIQAAAIRGVQVDLALPLRTDVPWANMASESFFADLLHVDVEPRRYLPGMLHAKAMICDDELGVVGSPNLDVRSFRLNYELALLLYDDADVQSLQVLVREIMADSEAWTIERFAARSVGRRILTGIARAFGPLL